jgi:hypothetical protein
MGKIVIINFYDWQSARVLLRKRRLIKRKADLHLSSRKSLLNKKALISLQISEQTRLNVV